MKFFALSIFACILFIGQIMGNEHKKIVILVSTPRSLTTAFERSFIERGDFEIIHEPWCARWYFDRRDSSSYEDFSLQRVKAKKDYLEVKKQLLDKASSHPLFVKDFSFSLYENILSDDEFIKDENVEFVFLIREPKKAMVSSYKKNTEYVWDVMTYDQLYEIYKKVWDVKGQQPCLVEASDLQNDSHTVMQDVCNAVNIPFLTHALTWSPGWKEEWNVKGFQKEEWNVSHEYQKEVMASTHFHKDANEGKDPFADLNEQEREELTKLYNSQIAFYNKLYKLKTS